MGWSGRWRGCSGACAKQKGKQNEESEKSDSIHLILLGLLFDYSNCSDGWSGLFPSLSALMRFHSSRDDLIIGYIEISLAQKSMITAEIYAKVIKAMIVPMEP